MFLPSIGLVKGVCARPSQAAGCAYACGRVLFALDLIVKVSRLYRVHGGAQVKSADDDSGLVTIIITDEQGQSASETLCQAVLSHIMRPDDPVSRLSPINAIVEVKTPLPRPISVSAHVTLIGAALGDVKAAFEAALNAYFAGGHDGAVRITRVGALLSGVAGVSDYSDLLLDGGSENIELTDMQLPVLAEGRVTLT